MIQYIEFQMFVSLTDRAIEEIKLGSNCNGITIQLLSKRHTDEKQSIKVSVDVPDFLYHGDYEENAVISDKYLFIAKLRQHLIRTGLPAQQLPYDLPFKTDKLTIGFNAFLGNRDLYREVIPPTECIRYAASNKWVYHNGPKTARLLSFIGQGKRVMRADDASSGIDYRRHISIHEGILSFRFDLTLAQMKSISSSRCLPELLDEDKLSNILKLWSEKLSPLPVFDSQYHIIQIIDGTNEPIHTKHRLKRFVKLLLECGLLDWEIYFSKASFVRNYSDLKRVLGVPAILLAEYNDSDTSFLQSYQEWSIASRLPSDLRAVGGL